MILDKEYGPRLRTQYLKVLLDASFDKLRTYSEDKILLFLSPCSRQASIVDANSAHSFSVIAAMSIPCAVCGRTHIMAWSYLPHMHIDK